MTAKSKIDLIGICWDKKSSYLQGPAQAPALIYEALFSPSSNVYSEYGIRVSHEEINYLGAIRPRKYEDIEKAVQPYVHAPLISLGGDHSITYPIIKAFHQVYDSFEILQIDAHADLYDTFDGDRYSHACPFARIMEEGLAVRLTQVGIRTLTPHLRDQATKFGVQLIEAQNFNIEEIQLKHPVYISLDLDALDPAFAPGVSHYEPGGLTTRQVLQIIQNIDVPIIGADIVEYNPTRDHYHVTAMVAGKFVKEICAKMISEVSSP